MKFSKPYRCKNNSNDFIFDNQILLQIIYGGCESALQHYEFAGFLGQISKNHLGDYAFSSLKTGNYSRAVDAYQVLSTINKKRPVSGFTQDCIDYNLGWSRAILSQYNNAQKLLALVQNKEPIESSKMPDACQTRQRLTRNLNRKKLICKQNPNTFSHPMSVG